MGRQRIPFPEGGRSDERASTDQPPATARQAQNVRGYDSTAGRLRGGQRAGLSAYLGSGNPTLTGSADPVQALASVSYARATDTYEQLGNPGASGSAGEVTEEWEKTLPLQDSGLDVQLDLQQNAFVLSSGGTITKYNSDGEEVYSFQAPLQPGETVSRRLALDGDSGIYAGAASTSGARIFRWLETEDGDGVELQWVHPADGNEVADIVAYAGALFVALNHDTGNDPSRVIQLSALVGTERLLARWADLRMPAERESWPRACWRGRCRVRCELGSEGSDERGRALPQPLQRVGHRRVLGGAGGDDVGGPAA
jgi:hypothetical protein